MHTIDCLGAGSPIVDTLAKVDDAFLAKVDAPKGGMILVDAARMNSVLSQFSGPLAEAPGGSAGNTVVALAHLGSKSGLLGKIGSDATGAFYVESLKKSGATDTRIKRGEGPSARCLSMITPDGERSMFTCLAAAATLSPAELTLADVKNCRLVHIEGFLFFSRALIDRLLALCAEAHVDVALDLGSFTVVNAVKEDLPGILKKSVKIVLANEDEARALLGNLPDEELARRLGELCPLAILKLGKHGSIVVQNGVLTRIAPIFVKNVVDTTGAGDTWAAGFLHAWLSGASVEKCGECGSILGAEVVQVVGAALPEEKWAEIRSRVRAVLAR
jgi:sugar/nucleoside kinase (ribokinase family)